jgi:hypothetical protein
MTEQEAFQIKVDVGPITLDSVIGKHRVYSEDGENCYDEPLTLGQALARRLHQDILVDRDRYNSLKDIVTKIRKEEVTAAVRAEVATAMEEPFRLTNHYGEATGQPVTLRALILAEAQKYFTEKKDGGYQKPSYTAAQVQVAEIVHKEMAKEIEAAIAEEKSKLVASFKATVSELFAKSLTKQATDGVRL